MQDNGSSGPPSLQQNEGGQISVSSLADVIQWFLDYDQRASVIRHPKVEELFQWKQEEARRVDENVYRFDHAEDRLAIGIMQALAEHMDESALHDWISQLLNALDDAAKTNEEMARTYKLKTDEADRKSTRLNSSHIP